MYRYLVILVLSLSSEALLAQRILHKTDEYVVYSDSIVQGKFTARAISANELTSNYRSPANESKSAAVAFKFSINGKDNEMKPGVDHHFIVAGTDNKVATPIIKFGDQLKEAQPSKAVLKANTLFRIRLDMREVLNAFKSQGYYTNYKGEKIYQGDFKGVYVAGNTAPLSWDFDNLANHSDLQLQDPDNDGIYEITLKMNDPENNKLTAPAWKNTKDLSSFPVYKSANLISDALYNLSVEEMINAVEPDSTFRTGKEWAGVWTRDISYSIILSMAHLQPQVAKNSLMRKVNKKKKIIQDTGTGGAWPASTDRMIWAVAAYEIYKVTGDKDWLQQAFIIIKNSIDADLNTIYDKSTGLVKGESSFLDWREQTYPMWMESADIAESECLGTNAVHYQANLVLSKMAIVLNNAAAGTKYLLVANRIKSGINNYLWQPEKHYFGQYLYGRNYKILSPKAEALGEALSVIFDIADSDKAKRVVANTPVTDYGISCIFPQIPGIPPYHNNAVWPFVQTYWLWAAGKVGNERAVMESIAAIYRPAAMFLTNKENFVADNGDFLGTEINSSNMLWSLAGNISVVHKVLFGIRFNEKSLSFEPCVPAALEGERTLANFKYRNAILDIEMKGYGNKVSQFFIDGKLQTRREILSSLKGHHNVKIFLANNSFDDQDINKVVNYTTLPTPGISYENGKLKWSVEGDVKEYQVFKNGKLLTKTTANELLITPAAFAEYQVIAIDEKDIPSFASEPVAVVVPSHVKTLQVEDYSINSVKAYKGFLGNGFVEINVDLNKRLSLPVNISENGSYAIDFRYANGNGPVNTDNKMAIRTLKVDGKQIGATLFPQRGNEEWSDWGFTNSNKVKLSKGQHTITLEYNPWNENMNDEVNQAMLDAVRIIKISN